MPKGKDEYLAGILARRQAFGVADAGTRTGRYPAAGPFPEMNAPKPGKPHKSTTQAVMTAPLNAGFSHGRTTPPGKPREAKMSITIRLDADVVRHFKKDGPGWQTRINEALRLWMERYSIIDSEK